MRNISNITNSTAAPGEDSQDLAKILIFFGVLFGGAIVLSLVSGLVHFIKTGWGEKEGSMNQRLFPLPTNQSEYSSDSHIHTEALEQYARELGDLRDNQKRTQDRIKELEDIKIPENVRVIDAETIILKMQIKAVKDFETKKSERIKKIETELKTQNTSCNLVISSSGSGRE